AVHFQQDIVLKIKLHAQVLQPLKVSFQPALSNVCRDIFEGILAQETLLQVDGQKLLFLHVSVAAHPEEEAHFWREPEAFHELLHEKLDASVTVRNWQPLDERTEPIPPTDGQERKVLHHLMSLESRIPGEQLIRAISSENNFNMLGG